MLAVPTLSRWWLRSSQRRRRARERRAGRGDRVRIVLLLLGWTLATGAHWDLVQVAAWGRMWLTYARVQPFTTALTTTFSPEAMCGVCRTVQAARADASNLPAVDIRAAEKAFLLLPFLRPLRIEAPPPTRFARAENSIAPESWQSDPAVPPPRSEFLRI